MIKLTLILPILINSLNFSGQVSYSGFIDKNKIELVTDIYSDGNARAIYSYSKFNTPITISGKYVNGKLELYEKDSKGNKANLVFDNFNPQSKSLYGIWRDLKNNKNIKITLNKNFEIESGNNIEWKNREIIQSVSMNNEYFKLILSKNKDDFYSKVTGIKILDKKTNKLLQKLDLDCQLLGLDNISIDDYNFDGFKDFSVFEASYAGSNTSRKYFLYDPKTKKYFDSGFTGTSLEFDHKKKRIHEHNQCCAGTSHIESIYKVEKNKMVLLEEHCYKWNDKKNALVEEKIEKCK
jgi:hypothetical protein